MTEGPARATRDLVAAELRSWVWERSHTELPRTPGEMADDLLRLLQARPCDNCGGDPDTCDCDES